VHVPDGFLDAPTSVATAVLAGGALAVSLRGARRELDDRVAPLAGLVAVFVFAAQLVAFPVGAGTSGHLLGGALAAVLVGPRTATVCLTVVVSVQALLFADGGVSALGTNVLLLAVVGPWVGYAVFAAVRALLPARPASVPVAAAVGAWASVVAVALAFVALYAAGGAAPIPLDALVAAMGTWHLLIGLGEAAITFLVVSSLIATRPDLVHGARPVQPQLAVNQGART
jgi:cobalt/nickel transport system permease protein